MHPAAGLLDTFRNVGINVVGHAGGERDDIVVRHLLDLVDFLNGEVRVVANPLGLFARDARLAELGLSLAGPPLDFLPDGELVLKLPNWEPAISNGGGVGIRTLDALGGPPHLAGEHLRPLGHSSA